MALLSIVLFLTAIIIYASKAGRNTFWFSLMLLLLTLFIVLNARCSPATILPVTASMMR